ncbi:TPA: DNA (cytosine-5-)-methyltransferase [Clostridium perfringens]|nr:DNA (cytosine-5-)-methyltransferase [Clostridium perfringens]HBI6969492.1 DNA (cytosine-5-)-methyltransferase [Clostridium perfringens]HBI6972534.1 DNA (cytosine-5-)-methyltransferase [Clostridium perfringens]HBI6986240.1 DNA (cytosine-5-)-methyltransferase [Clostridium perfringens]HBI7004440.1 DNA (cytosine-5-)-methyltransferase [Clostridium perfringens]
MDKTVCELFAGVGGFHLGLSRAGGWEVIWANQWEPNKTKQYAYECYKNHFPRTESLNIDIAKVNDNEDKYPIPNHTLLVGGFPCQDYSVASTLAKGIQGKKGVLWWEIEKIINRKRPPFILLENVDRLLKSPANQRGRDFGIMLTCFKNLGYNVEWRVINAADYGFAQRRRRVFIFAYNKETKFSNKVIENIKKVGIDEYLINNSFFNKDFKIESTIKKSNCILNKDLLEISDNFSFEFYESGILRDDEIVSFKVKPKNIAPINLRDVLEKNVDERFYIGNDLEKWNYMKGAKAEKRKSKTGHEYMYREGAVAFPDSLDLPARTMLTSESSKNRSTHVVEDPITKKLRVLTPIECERLNGFDDNWTNTGMTEKFRYFCMGNALVVGLIEIMGERIKKIVEEEN